MKRKLKYLRCLSGVLLMTAAINAFGSGRWPGGEDFVALRAVTAAFTNGKLVAECAPNGDLEKLSLDYKGKTLTLGSAEIAQLPLADLQTIRITAPADLKSSEYGNREGYVFVTMAFGEKHVTTDSVQWVRRHVRFEFIDGIYQGRFVAVPDPLKHEWRMFFKDPGRNEQEVDKHSGAEHPWSLSQAYADDGAYRGALDNADATSNKSDSKPDNGKASPTGNGEPPNTSRTAPRHPHEGPSPAKPGSAPQNPRPDPAR